MKFSVFMIFPSFQFPLQQKPQRLCRVPHGARLRALAASGLEHQVFQRVRHAQQRLPRHAYFARTSDSTEGVSSRGAASVEMVPLTRRSALGVRPSVSRSLAMSRPCCKIIW